MFHTSTEPSNAGNANSRASGLKANAIEREEVTQPSEFATRPGVNQDERAQQSGLLACHISAIGAHRDGGVGILRAWNEMRSLRCGGIPDVHHLAEAR